jgi:DNA-binding HxlR family transcriptional regulator
MSTVRETPAQPQFTCPVDGFQQMVNGKHKLRIIWALQQGPRRYGEIKKGLLKDMSGTTEISPRVLSRELKKLAEFGLITRTDYKVVPPKVEYALTPKGRQLLPIIARMIEFRKRHLVRGGAPALRPVRSG